MFSINIKVNNGYDSLMTLPNIKGVDQINIDQENNRFIQIKNNKLGEYNINQKNELESFNKLPIPEYTQILVDYKLKLLVIITFLDGIIVQDLNNGLKIDKLSKDYKGIITATFDDDS